MTLDDLADDEARLLVGHTGACAATPNPSCPGCAPASRDALRKAILRGMRTAFWAGVVAESAKRADEEAFQWEHTALGLKRLGHERAEPVSVSAVALRHRANKLREMYEAVTGDKVLFRSIEERSE